MTDLQKFAKLLKDEGIRYFTAKEVFFLGGSNEKLKLNSTPPQELWKNILPTLRVVDEAREIVGKIRLSSIYRNQVYNRRIGGARFSTHMNFNACDCDPLECSPAELYNVFLALRREGKFAGGIGLYKSFVHVDTRGTNSNWKG
jgi:uncharacterized protein YcbK (DUF882 family)